MADEIVAPAPFDTATSLIHRALPIAAHADDFVAANAELDRGRHAAIGTDGLDLARRSPVVIGKQGPGWAPLNALTAGFTGRTQDGLVAESSDG